MKNIVIYITGFLAIILILVISCNERENLEKKNENVKMNFEGFQPDSIYTYRSKTPSTYGDSTFLIKIKFNSHYKVTQINVSVVESNENDKLSTHIFFNDTIMANNDSVWFSWSSGAEDIWILDLDDAQMMKMSDPDQDGNCTIECFCPSPCTGECWVATQYDANCGSFDCWCVNADFNACSGSCDAHSIRSINNYYGPAVIIQADNVRYNGVTYD